MVDRYGFAACVDHRVSDWKERLRAACPDGATIHFENVGTEPLAVGMGLLRAYGRVILCGLAGHYHSDQGPALTAVGPIVAKRAAVYGLVVYDFYPRFAEWLALAEPWVKQGRLTQIEDRGEGLDSAPRQLERLMRGENLGKTLTRISG